jgi:hypothetical protein
MLGHFGRNSLRAIISSGERGTSVGELGARGFGGGEVGSNSVQVGKNIDNNGN